MAWSMAPVEVSETIETPNENYFQWTMRVPFVKDQSIHFVFLGITLFWIKNFDPEQFINFNKWSRLAWLTCRRRDYFMSWWEVFFEKFLWNTCHVVSCFKFKFLSNLGPNLVWKTALSVLLWSLRPCKHRNWFSSSSNVSRIYGM